MAGSPGVLACPIDGPSASSAGANDKLKFIGHSKRRL